MRSLGSLKALGGLKPLGKSELLMNNLNSKKHPFSRSSVNVRSITELIKQKTINKHLLKTHQKMEKIKKKAVRKHFRVRNSKLGLSKRRITRKKMTKKCQQNDEILDSMDIKTNTGITQKMFEQLCLEIKNKVEKKTYQLQKHDVRSHKLSTNVRIFLVLYWLWYYPELEEMRNVFNVSPSTVSRELNYIIPILVEHLNYVKFPDFPEEGFEDAIGSIDGTDHKRNREHPGCYRDFRADKQCFFIFSQVVIGNKGHLYNFQFASGHNNDKGVYNKSWVKEFLYKNDFKFLADGGYSDVKLVSPSRKKGKFWNDKQKQLRSLVEIVIGYVKDWKVAEAKFKQNRMFQECCLYVVYQLLAWRIKENPIRL